MAQEKAQMLGTVVETTQRRRVTTDADDRIGRAFTEKPDMEIESFVETAFSLEEVESIGVYEHSRRTGQIGGRKALLRRGAPNADDVQHFVYQNCGGAGYYMLAAIVDGRKLKGGARSFAIGPLKEIEAGEAEYAATQENAAEPLIDADKELKKLTSRISLASTLKMLQAPTEEPMKVEQVVQLAAAMKPAPDPTMGAILAAIMQQQAKMQEFMFTFLARPAPAPPPAAGLERWAEVLGKLTPESLRSVADTIRTFLSRGGGDGESPGVDWPSLVATAGPLATQLIQAFSVARAGGPAQNVTTEAQPIQPALMPAPNQGQEGASMPPQVPPMTKETIDNILAWIAEGDYPSAWAAARSDPLLGPYVTGQVEILDPRAKAAAYLPFWRALDPRFRDQEVTVHLLSFIAFGQKEKAAAMAEPEPEDDE